MANFAAGRFETRARIAERAAQVGRLANVVLASSLFVSVAAGYGGKIAWHHVLLAALAFVLGVGEIAVYHFGTLRRGIKVSRLAETCAQAYTALVALETDYDDLEADGGNDMCDQLKQVVGLSGLGRADMGEIRAEFCAIVPPAIRKGVAKRINASVVVGIDEGNRRNKQQGRHKGRKARKTHTPRSSSSSSEVDDADGLAVASPVAKAAPKAVPKAAPKAVPKAVPKALDVSDSGDTTDASSDDESEFDVAPTSRKQQPRPGVSGVL